LSEQIAEPERRVSSLELFFDLVFVFAFTQVTALLVDDVSWAGLGRGVLVLTVLWWAWASYAWLTNAVDPEAGPVTAVILVSIGAMFIGALAVPEALGRHRLVFALAFLIVMVAFLGLYAIGAKDQKDLMRAVARAARPTLAGASLILGAAFVPSELRPLLWLGALAVGFFGAILLDVGGWSVNTGHFAERHGLIVIIAIGEALAAIGIGARATALDGLVITASILGLIVAASFWLAYFDYASGGVQSLLSRLQGRERIALARDVYTYLHLPMVLGIVLFAFGMKVTLAHIHTKLHVVPAFALFVGSAVYLLAYVALRWRVSRQVSRGRGITTLLLAALFPVALVVPPIAALSLLAAVWVGLHAYELIFWRAERARRRAETRTPGLVETEA
jgi:low temperature requirement protein LtrA